eukprot:7386072-Prymnesium_polylepis.1
MGKHRLGASALEQTSHLAQIGTALGAPRAECGCLPTCPTSCLCGLPALPAAPGAPAGRPDVEFDPTPGDWRRLAYPRHERLNFVLVAAQRLRGQPVVGRAPRPGLAVAEHAQLEAYALQKVGAVRGAEGGVELGQCSRAWTRPVVALLCRRAGGCVKAPADAVEPHSARLVLRGAPQVLCLLCALCGGLVGAAERVVAVQERVQLAQAVGSSILITREVLVPQQQPRHTSPRGMRKPVPVEGAPAVGHRRPERGPDERKLLERLKRHGGVLPLVREHKVPEGDGDLRCGRRSGDEDHPVGGERRKGSTMLKSAVRLHHPHSLVAHALAGNVERPFVIAAHVGAGPTLSDVLERGAHQGVARPRITGELHRKHERRANTQSDAVAVRCGAVSRLHYIPPLAAAAYPETVVTSGARLCMVLRPSPLCCWHSDPRSRIASRAAATSRRACKSRESQADACF